ncbi:LysR family transcriptional regulator [Leeia oryzae]|uniref:LysR family transcriptional regulator n=1 Tax=Leeia oryzae TaxID=356662 RepID=UPI000368D459|nr:LysR family transcriptional regulator [Leeia oryzae]
MKNLGPLEIRHLETLLSLEQTGSFTETGKALHLTQSAISYQIKQLEEHYETPLLVRKSNPPQFTAAGLNLIQLAKDVRSLLRFHQEKMDHIIHGEAGRLRISVACHSSFDWLLPANDAFHKKWPDVELDFVLGWQADPVTLLRQGTADLVIMSEPAELPGISVHPLFSFDIRAIVAKDHPAAQNRFISAEDFKDETLVCYPLPDHRLDVVHRVLTPAGIKPEKRHVELTAAIIQLVALRQGIAALPAWSAAPYEQRGYIVTKPVTHEGLTCNLYAATLTDYGDLLFVQEFISEIRKAGLALIEGSYRA